MAIAFTLNVLIYCNGLYREFTSNLYVAMNKSGVNSKGNTSKENKKIGHNTSIVLGKYSNVWCAIGDLDF